MNIESSNSTFKLPSSAAAAKMGFNALDFSSPDAKVQVAAASNGSASNFRTALLEQIKSSSTEDAKVTSTSDKAHKAAQQFVSSALILPLLKQMRSSTFKSDLFHGGQGEDAFGPQLDQILSDRIVKRMSTPEKLSASGSATQSMGLVDAVYKQIMRTNEHKSTRQMKSAVQTTRPADLSNTLNPANLKPTSANSTKVDLHG